MLAPPKRASRPLINFYSCSIAGCDLANLSGVREAIAAAFNRATFHQSSAETGLQTLDLQTLFCCLHRQPTAPTASLGAVGFFIALPKHRSSCFCAVIPGQNRTSLNFLVKVSAVQILAILGDSTYIDIQADRQFLSQLPHAKVTFLARPQKSRLHDQLWGAAHRYFVLCGS